VIASTQSAGVGKKRYALKEALLRVIQAGFWQSYA